MLADESGEAPVSRDEELSILRRLSAFDPNNVNFDEDLMRELSNSGIVCVGRHEYPEAINLLREALSTGERLDNSGLSNFQIEDLEADTAFCLSHCYTRTGDLDSATAINSKTIPQGL